MGDHAVDTNGNVAIETAAGKTVATFKVSGTYASANFHVGKDASGHVLVTYVTTSADAAIDEVRGGSAADLLGGYYSHFHTSVVEHNDGLVGLKSVLPVLGVETYTGSLADRSDGNSGARATPGASPSAGTARPATGLACNSSWVGLR